MRQNHQILVADDNEVNQTVVKRMLEHAGYQVDTVRNGADAITALEKNLYDLVIMDCMMPGMDGFTATRIIRRSVTARFDPQVPILATTALASAKDREKCLEAGMTEFVSKPIIAKSFLALVASYLECGEEVEIGKQPSGPTELPDEEAQTKFQAEVLKSLSQRIVSDAELWRQEIKAHGDAGEFEKLGMLAHKIRGTADIIGKKELSELAEKVETSTAMLKSEQARSLSIQMDRELKKLILEVSQET